MQTLPLIRYSYFEVVLQQIYDILVFEEANQEAQAEALDLNPADFSWRNQLEDFLNISSAEDLDIPLVHIWFSSSTYDGTNTRTTQQNYATYNLDVYAKADSTEDGDAGLTIASATVNRVIRQIFAILKSPKYYKLGFPLRDESGKPIVFIEDTRFQATTKFQPEKATVSVDNVIAARMEFRVKMTENIADLEGVALQQILVNINAPTGEENPGVLVDL